MRTFILVLFLLCSMPSTCQELSMYKDSTYQFEIGMPVGWKYGKLKEFPKLIFLCSRNPIDTTDKFVENFNVNIVSEANLSIDKAFDRMLYYNQKLKDFQVLKKGTKTISGQSFRWVISTTANEYVDQLMINYVLLTYKDDKAYILTFVSTPKNFDSYFTLFERVAETFNLN